MSSVFRCAARAKAFMVGSLIAFGSCTISDNGRDHAVLDLTVQADCLQLRRNEWLMPVVTITNRSDETVEVPNPLLGPLPELMAEVQWIEGCRRSSRESGCSWSKPRWSATIRIAPDESASYWELVLDQYDLESAAQSRGTSFFRLGAQSDELRLDFELVPGEGCGRRALDFSFALEERADLTPEQMIVLAEAEHIPGYEDDALFILAHLRLRKPEQHAATAALLHAIATQWPERDYGRHAANVARLLLRQIEEQQLGAGGAGGE